MSLAVINTERDGARVGLRADPSGTITAFGPDVTPLPGDHVIDGIGTAIIEPLVNAHTHAAMTLFRGYGSDVQLQEWLEHYIWPAEARLTDDDVYWGTRLAAVEMIRSGTTSFLDMYWKPEVVARAVADAGLRATVGTPLIDMGDPANLADLQRTAKETLEAIQGTSGYGTLVTASVAPHAIYTVSGPSLEWVASFAAEHDLLVHIHFCETLREVDEFQKANDGLSPTVYLDQRGLLGPKVVLAHSCVMTPDDYALVAERGATVVTNPASNLKLASGKIFPYATAKAAGVSVGLGTDGASSNNSLDLFADLKLFSLLQKHEAYDPTILPAAEALEIAQGRHSPVLGGHELAVGSRADFLLVRTDLPQMAPGHLVDNLVYAANGDVVDTVVVDGKVLMEGRVVHAGADGATEADIIREARRCASTLLTEP